MKKHPMSVMIKPASGLCNMRCRYCFYCDEMENRSQKSFGIMKAATLENVIRKTMEAAAGECCFAFQGGEPTLAGLPFFEKVVELEDKYKSAGLRVSNAIQTNGYAIDKKWAQFFAQSGFLVGVSIDGIAETHDRMRRGADGEGSFARVSEATSLLDESGADYNILTVVNSVTAPKIGEIYEYYRSRGWHWLQFIPCLDPLEAGAQEWSLSAEVYGKFLCELFDLWYADAKKGRQPSIRSFENYLGMLLGYAAESCDMCESCGVQYVVEADGSVYPCDFYMLDSFRLGSLNTDSVAQLDRQRASIKFIESSVSTPTRCRGCKYLSLCMNSCQRRRGADGISVFCSSYKRFFDYALTRMENIAERLRQG